MQRFRWCIAVWVSLSLVACTALRPMDAARPESVRAALKVGDEVSVQAANGKTYLLVLTAVDAEKIVGAGDNKKVTIRYEQIQSIEVRQWSAGKTAGLAGGTIAVLVVLGALAVAAIAKGLGALGAQEANDNAEMTMP